MFADRGRLFDVGDRPDVVGANERAEASDGLLEHGVRADDIEELLGRAGAAAGPEARAAASGENNCVSGEFVGRHGFQANKTFSIASFEMPLRARRPRSCPMFGT